MNKIGGFHLLSNMVFYRDPISSWPLALTELVHPLAGFAYLPAGLLVNLTTVKVAEEPI